MKKFWPIVEKLLPTAALLLGLAYLASTLVPPRNSGAFDVVGFGRLPVLADGRLKPMDTLARTSLLQLQNRQRVGVPTNTTPLVASPTEWLLDVFFRPEKADTYPTFVVDNPELLSLIGKNDANLAIKYPSSVEQFMAVADFLPGRYRRFSYVEIFPYLAEIEKQARLADTVDDKVRNVFQRAVLHLYANLSLYQRLEHTLQPPDTHDFLGELLIFEKALPDGIAAVQAEQAGKPHNEEVARGIIDSGKRYLALAQATNILAIPPARDATDLNAWTTSGQAILGAFDTGNVDPGALAYAGIGYAWQNQNPDQFNQVISLFRTDLAGRFASQLKKCDAETRFNAAEPFYSSMLLYITAFFLAVFSWLAWPQSLGKAAFRLVALAWLATTVGIVIRMWLGGRRP